MVPIVDKRTYEFVERHAFRYAPLRSIYAAGLDTDTLTTLLLSPHSRHMRITWQEVSGACGDLGTFLPLTVALVHAVGLDLGTTLIMTGVFNIAVGFLFDVPLPVQPMKAICAIAIATPSALGLEPLLAAGLFVGTQRVYSDTLITSTA